ncbi:MAG: hypothetical protein COV30_00695 [Candidatus Yanofskybacteria bacterium CG10_big_fil_rev_8_21_14_0_10_37_15]|uniref:Uncharacterized protein n=1 Tax=Candidatus Yanofskybacteria bacterium CG10_big_fil_rev_8_21_14_0_10_37_15 TaxID=1975097 RepID=A0A2H0R668_9BACT|nr:MAG: hypothetical protein COV30_00695 [Candidatus Yanofskybacteria bacterium CG10_big_fil_rev_8_21_14_0_10_37_15]
MFNKRFYVGLFFTILFYFFSFYFVVYAAPAISSIEPVQAVPGSEVTITGTELTDSVTLNMGNDTPISAHAIVNEEKTIVRFQIPLEIQSGDYTIIMLEGTTITASPIKLKISAGGDPFPASKSQPTIPSQNSPTNLGQLIQQIFTWSLSLLGVAIFVSFFYAGFLWLTAAGNTAKTGEAKKRMTNAIFGAILLLSAYLILNTINPNFVRSSLTLPGLGKPNNAPPPDNSSPVPTKTTPNEPPSPSPIPVSISSIGDFILNNPDCSGNNCIRTGRIEFEDGEWLDLFINSDLSDIPLGLSYFNITHSHNGFPPTSSSAGLSQTIFYFRLTAKPGFIWTTIHLGYGGELSGVPIMPGPITFTLFGANTDKNKIYKITLEGNISEEAVSDFKPNYITYAYFNLNPPDFIKNFPGYYETTIRVSGGKQIKIDFQQAEKAVSDGNAEGVLCYIGSNLYCFYESDLTREEFIALYGGFIVN